MKRLVKSAEQGHAGAQNSLAICYDNGEGVAKDLKKAVKWFTKSAEQGDATAQYNLAIATSMEKESQRT